MDNYTTCPQCGCTFEATSAARRAELESLLALEQSANARLRAEVERLRGEAERERAAVVAWLRELGAINAMLSPCLGVADDIERGEHRREGTK